MTGVTTGNQSHVNPMLAPLANNGGATLTRALLAASPAIDAGNPAAPGSTQAACASTDQRGLPRPQNGDGTDTARCDIGAFEVEAAPVAGCPPGSSAITGYRYRITRGTRTIDVDDLTGRVEQGDHISTFVTVAPNCTGVNLALVSYQAPGPTYDPAVEQGLYATDARVVGSGEHQLQVAVPSCYFQVNLIVGLVLPRIGPPNDYYRERVVDGANGGRSVCGSIPDQQPGPTPAPSAAPSPSPAPPVLPGETGTHRIFVSFVTR